MTFKKGEMAKTPRNGLSMIETNPLNHNWLDFAIQFVRIAPVSKKMLLNKWGPLAGLMAGLVGAKTSFNMLIILLFLVLGIYSFWYNMTKKELFI